MINLSEIFKNLLDLTMQEQTAPKNATIGSMVASLATAPGYDE